MALIYVVEDDKNIQEIETFALANVGYEVKGFDSAMDFYEALNDTTPDLILLDIMLPDEDGLSIVKKLRTRQDTVLVPVIMVTAKTTEIDKVKGLDLGADDYVTKPFYMGELLARIRTSLRHSNRMASNSPLYIRPYKCQGLILDFEKRMLTLDGEEIHLTPVEYKIVAYLARNSGKVMTYASVMANVWGPFTDNNNRILRVNMANIRRKIERNPSQPQFLFTEVGVGYRMCEDENEV